MDDLAKKLQLLAMETDQDKSNRKKKAGKTGKMFVPPTRVSIYNWMADTCRPDEGNMILICKVLDRPTEEGLRQYTPRVEGRPQGYSPKSTFVRTK